MKLLAPSILSADFGQLNRDFDLINSSEADWFHVDVMDGQFVPNISFGFPVLKALKKVAKKTIDVHLMIERPEQFIEQFAEAGADYITVHAETCPHLHRTIQQIKATGVKAGVALNPHSSLSAVEHILEDIDLLLLMSVNPGFGGQKFLPLVFDKLKALSNSRPENLLVEIDGGVSLDNCAQLCQAGADVLVAGNAVFGSQNPMETIAQMKGRMNS